jgi:hypothetical protein
MIILMNTNPVAVYLASYIVISKNLLLILTKAINKCSLHHCRPLLQKNVGRGSPFNVSYQNCCKKTDMSMTLKI